MNIAMAVAVLLVIGGAGYYLLRPAKAPSRPADVTMNPQELVSAVGFHLGRVSGALMSGEVRDLGVAVAVAENEMATTCRGMGAGTLLTVKSGELTLKAELLRVNTELDICTISVKGSSPGLKMRPGLPGAQEKIQAIVFDAAGKPEARAVNVAKTIQDPKGVVFEVKTFAPLPNGTPLFDSQARLVGLVTAPSTLGEPNAVVALGTGRIAQARGVAAEATTVASSNAPAGSAPPAPPVASSTPASPPASVSKGAGKVRGVKVDEGFTTLWKENSRGATTEVLDSVKTGAIGDPIAYWTKWTGRDVGTSTACLVTFGDEDEIIAAFEQTSGTPTSDGYWSCGLTRFQVDLNDLEKGDYTFTIYADGEPVASGTTRVERKFWTRDKYAIIVIVLGLYALFLVRRKKELGSFFGKA